MNTDIKAFFENLAERKYKENIKKMIYQMSLTHYVIQMKISKNFS